MPDIRYVCLSDMHLGAETSLLTEVGTGGRIEPDRPSPVLNRLVDCLREVILKNEDRTKKPVLVLNGDILELALAQDNDASMAFQRFIELTMLNGQPLFSSIIYNPGNHDHHLWETARETQYAEYMKKLPWETKTAPPWHVSPIFERWVDSYSLNSLLKRNPNLQQLNVSTAYPNLGLLSKDRGKAVIFHHGHLTEELYLALSIMKSMLFPGSRIPQDVWGIEGENFAWIDFFWSTLGRSSDAGIGVGRVYEKLQDDGELKILLHHLSEGLAKRFGKEGWLPDRIEAALIDFALNQALGIGSTERRFTEKAFSEGSERQLIEYMKGPLQDHIMREIKFVPDNITFIFGHTHKPWQDLRDVENYKAPVAVYNSGGWVVDKVERETVYGGAVILLDEDLNCVSLKMYNESNQKTDYCVKIAEVLRKGETNSALFSKIDGLLSPGLDPWKAFSETVEYEIKLRAKHLHDRIHSPAFTSAPRPRY